MFFRSTEEEKRGCPKARIKSEKSAQNLARLRVWRRERKRKATSTVPANPESLCVSLSWVNKKRLSECQSQSSISHRWREQTSHRDVTTVNINLLSPSSAIIHKGISYWKATFLKRKVPSLFFSTKCLWSVFFFRSCHFRTTMIFLCFALMKS